GRARARSRGGGRARLGYALALANASLQSERLIYRSIEEARRMAGFHDRRMVNRARELVRDILVNDRLSILFQPIVDLGGNHVCGYEALARGPIETPVQAPRDLFNLARSANLLGELWMSCIDRTILRADACPSDRSLFINVTPSLLHDDYIQSCLARAEEVGMGADRFVLELSEQIAVRNYEMLRKKLEGPRERGVRIAIDDLGTGYSNLNQIMRLQPDFLKIDMSLVRDVHADKAKQALIESLTRVAESLGSTVIAEGIEHREERDTLAELGVELAQGFFYAQPEDGFWEPRAA
ncbi:MAG: EAL domain-containing protein, partial [Myxococcota bacterium]